MRLILRQADAGSGDPVIDHNDDFTEPFLPNTGDMLAFASGQNVRVTGRRFSFSAGVPNVQGVESSFPTNNRTAFKVG